MTRAIAAFLLFSTSVLAQEAASTQPQTPAQQPPQTAVPSTSPEPIDLPQAGMQATVPGEKSVINIPQSVDVVTRTDLTRNEGLFLDDVINLIPGVRYETRTLTGGQLITIRGYGQGSNFNGTGYKAYLNGIPITDAEGTTILNDVDPSTLGRIEVIKGPASSLYGSGIAGVVKFYTLQPEPMATKFTQEVVTGSDSLIRSNTRAENADENSAFVINYGHQQSDGYRPHSDSDRDYAMISDTYRPNAKEQLFVYGSYNHAYDQLPGEMTPQQFLLRDSNYFDPQYVTNNAHIGIDGARLGLSNKYSFTPGIANTTSAFGTYYTLDQPSAVGLTDNAVVSAGGRTEFTARVDLGAWALDGTLGTEIERSSAFKKSYALTNGKLGGIRGDLQVVSLVSNSFLEANARLPYGVDVTAGASVDFVHYNIQDRLANSANPTHLNGSGVISFDPVFTPRVAVLKSFGQELSVYGQVSLGYTPPASTQVVIAQSGSVNNALKPEHGTLYEVGSKGNLLGGRLSYEAALFDLVVSDKLTPETVTDSFGTYTITVNSGKQNDIGLELAAKFALWKESTGPLQLVQLFGSYAYSSFHYDGFKSNAASTGIDYTDKPVVGVPPHVVNLGLDVVSGFGIYANATFEHVSPMSIVYDASVAAPAYGLLDAKVGYRNKFAQHFMADLAVGSRNLTSTTYYTEVFLNMLGAAGQGVFLNGPYNATFYGMLSLSYVL